MSDINEVRERLERDAEGFFETGIAVPTVADLRALLADHARLQEIVNAKVCYSDNDGDSWLSVARAKPARYLTKSELDSIGSQAEGMDGDQWDRWVQAKFAEVNGLATVDSDDVSDDYEVEEVQP